MNIQEFLKDLNTGRLAEFYCNKYGELSLEKVYTWLNDLKSIEIIKSDKTVYALRNILDADYDVFYINNEDELEDKLTTNHYSLDFLPIKEALGINISKACRYYIDDDYLYASILLYELSFLGYNGKEHDNKIEDICKLLNSIEEEKSNTSWEEFKEKFNLPERKSYEKDFDTQIAYLNEKTNRKLLEQLLTLDKKYSENC